MSQIEKLILTVLTGIGMLNLNLYISKLVWFTFI